MTDRQTAIDDWAGIHLTGTPARQPTDDERAFGDTVDTFESALADALQ